MNCDVCDRDHSEEVVACDYEQCAGCGYDHGYEYEEAVRWHWENGEVL